MMKRNLLMLCMILGMFAYNAWSQIRIEAQYGIALPTDKNTAYKLDGGRILGAGLLYEIPSVEGLSVELTGDLVSGKGDSVYHYRFIPFTIGVNYVWQFAPTCGLSTHIGVGINSRNVEFVNKETEKGVSFAYKVGLDLLFARHISVGFRWNGLGNATPYESVPVAWDEYGNVTRYEQRKVESDEFSIGYFTLLVGIRL